jgi:uncharacterized protein YjiS (DUF1127 family)
MTRTIPASIATALIAALDWIATRDAAYRQARRLARCCDARLADMGLTRAEADAAFYSQIRGNRPVDQTRAVLTGGI